MHEEYLQKLIQESNFRDLKELRREGKMLVYNNLKMLNLSSNDYLGIASDILQSELEGIPSLQSKFFSEYSGKEHLLTSSSSRLLTGNFTEYEEFEAQLTRDYNKEAALVFNGGYHANSGVLPALATAQDLILSDKLMHASLIDGLRLSSAKSLRFRHNDYEQLERLVQDNVDKYQNIFIVVESIYSMDGDMAPLEKIVQLRKGYKNIFLYVDEAHAVGVRGDKGLGLCEELSLIDDVDIIMGTLGKALASFGSFVVCSKQVRDLLINKMRPFIFTTAMPPLNVAWANYVWNISKQMSNKREHLKKLSNRLKSSLSDFFDEVKDSRSIYSANSFEGENTPDNLNSSEKAVPSKGLTSAEAAAFAERPLHSDSSLISINSDSKGRESDALKVSLGGSEHYDTQIVPIVLGEAKLAVLLSEHLQRSGFFVLPIRPPTVPEGQSRVRISLTADLAFSDVDNLVTAVKAYHSNI